MGLFRSHQYDRDSTLGIWEITENLEDLKQACSAEGFSLSGMNRIHSPLKQAQWLAARLLIRSLLSNKTEVHYHEDKAPYLHTGPLISMSHSSHRVCVQLAETFVPGVDIQDMSDKILRVKEKFAHPTELDFIAEESVLTSLNIIWCAKEAVYKSCRQPGLIFSQDIILDPFNLGSSGSLTAQVNTLKGMVKMALHYEILDNYALAYIVNR